MSSYKAPRPTPVDHFRTATSDLQEETEEIIHSTGLRSSGPPLLRKNEHLHFLLRNLRQGFPARYVHYDASQPWLLFWTLQGFSVLQVGMDPDTKQRAVDTIMAWQHPGGGFGGGPGQAAHLLPTYASVCALAIVGRPGPGGGWDQIDREKIYSWFLSLKQPDGSFLVSHDGEVDTRGIYCLLVVACLLNVLTPELVAGTAAFIASCQTYEGGFASASHPYFPAAPPAPPASASAPAACLPSPRPNLGEAHGGYTSCALAAWVLLEPLLPAAPAAERPRIDEKRLLRWLVGMQGGAMELGGFRGRTNKLVDGCYSWWVGGAFALLEALGVSGYGHPAGEAQQQQQQQQQSPHQDAGDEAWDDVDDSMFNRKALQEYVLLAGQHPAGGLRDKPPKNSDAYHTLYCLAGLSAAQHRVFPSAARKAELHDSWTSTSAEGAGTPEDEFRRAVFAACLCWTEEEGTSKIVGLASNKVNATHPLFNMTITHTEAVMGHFYNQTVPKHAPKT
ncbi:hypothetical protein HETIRDRAFT_478327 [Heterobasidion irregulare TC 32-1]|uniref:Protein farnesyltransferase subunit beta n=1 Tax=Heterobasidion irregulare (strain TC 32-1) TaxID=747525 RepID=W4K1Q2_HETIT|nr:uncharacterized protein HETIRDRAFT_478327 [Heterobasidion irregulare TC 32-1]ETW79021.1 hypothetical protein HETIRDRAFT_478327 [Heterobasidion irregulare TC 32-1]